jgi:hypothetical protein
LLNLSVVLYVVSLLFPVGRAEVKDKRGRRNDFPEGKPAAVPVPAPARTFPAVAYNKKLF